MLCMLKCYYSLFRSLLNSCLEALMTANQSLCVCYYERSLEPSPEGIVLNLNILCISYSFIQ